MRRTDRRCQDRIVCREPRGQRGSLSTLWHSRSMQGKYGNTLPQLKSDCKAPMLHFCAIHKRISLSIRRGGGPIGFFVLRRTLLQPESPFSAPIQWSFTAFREELRDHPGISGEKPGGSLSSWTRPHNREPSSSISPTLVPLTLSSSIRFTAFPVSCQFAGSGNSATLRNISANCTRVRCPSVQHQPIVPRMFYQPPTRLHQPLLQAGQNPVIYRSTSVLWKRLAERSLLQNHSVHWSHL